tara:strand:- start:6150 stop:6347 length:198 start_codon:yes stop_codon:yes gene_type:complete
VISDEHRSQADSFVEFQGLINDISSEERHDHNEREIPSFVRKVVGYVTTPDNRRPNFDNDIYEDA